MRYKIEIHAAGLLLNQVQAKELLAEIDSFDGLDSAGLQTGRVYDSEIEKEGNDSEDLFTRIDFYANGEAESVSNTGNEVLDRVNELYEIRENGLFFTVTEVDSIVQYD